MRHWLLRGRKSEGGRSDETRDHTITISRPSPWALVLGAAAFFLSASAPAQEIRAEPRPNLLVVMVDDLGWQDTSLRLTLEKTALNQRYRTPHLERLARRGLRFPNAYAAGPVCTPTRTSLMTGLSPARSHITYWTQHRDRDTSRRHPSLRAPAWRMNGIASSMPTLPRLLAEEGYRTIHVGKAHFGARGAFAADPLKIGFQRNVAGHAAGAPGSYWGEHHFSVDGRQGRAPGTKPAYWDVPGLEAYKGEKIFLTEALTRDARREMKSAVSAGRPFFLHFAPYAVHTPIMPNPALVERYSDLHPTEAAYASMIESVDRALGALLEELDTLAPERPTWIVFTSDNGGLSASGRAGPAHRHNAPLRSGKGSAYEGGVRVPLVIARRAAGPAAPRRRQRATTGGWRRHSVVTTDLFPTLLGLAGASLPPALAGKIDGQDLRPLLNPGTLDLETVAQLDRRAILWHQPHQWGARGPGIEPFSALRLENYKLIWFHADRRFELYDLDRDLSETKNLAAERPALLRRLRGRLAAELERRGAQLSLDARRGRPIAGPLD